MRLESGGIAAKLVEREAAIIVHARMTGHRRERRVEFGNGLLMTAERRMGDAAIEPRLGMLRRAGQKLLEFGERLLGAAEAEQRVGVLIENGEVVAIERARLVEACECFVVALERVLHLTEIGPGARRAWIDLDRGGQQAMRLAHASELRLDGAELIERLEIIGRRLEHARKDLLGVAQLALALQGHCLVKRLIDVERRRHGATAG